MRGQTDSLISSQTRANFFCERVINVWNSLPVTIVDFSSVTRFKWSLSKVDFTSFMKRFDTVVICVCLFVVEAAVSAPSVLYV